VASRALPWLRPPGARPPVTSKSLAVLPLTVLSIDNWEKTLKLNAFFSKPAPAKGTLVNPRRRIATAALSEPTVFRLALPLVVALALPGPPAWAGAILFDNLSAGSPNGSFGVSNTQWTAQSFATTTAGFILDEVSIRLWNLNGTSGNFEIQVWDALGAGGRPGAQVGAAVYTGLAEDLGSSSGSLLAVSGLNFTLTPDTTYYLVAAGTSLTDIPDDFFSIPGTLYWDATDVVTSPSYGTGNSGAGWNGPFSQNLYMKVTAVPEPSTYAMALAGLAGGGYTMFRRRKRR
jgi:hypothetical protein